MYGPGGAGGDLQKAGVAMRKKERKQFFFFISVASD